MSYRQNPTFWPGATCAVRCRFHSEYRMARIRWKWLWLSAYSNLTSGRPTTAYWEELCPANWRARWRTPAVLFGSLICGLPETSIGPVPTLVTKPVEPHEQLPVPESARRVEVDLRRLDPLDGVGAEVRGLRAWARGRDEGEGSGRGGGGAQEDEHGPTSVNSHGR